MANIPPKYELPPPPVMFPSPPRPPANNPHQEGFPGLGVPMVHSPPTTGFHTQINQPIHGDSRPQRPSQQEERDRAANEAILASMQGAANRYVRQEMEERLGLNEEANRAHKPLEFHSSSPSYNFAIVATLGVTVFGLMPIIGSLSLTVALIGAGCVYIADYLGYRKGSVLVLLGALGMFQFSLMLTNARHILHNTGTFLALLNTAVVCAVVAAVAVTQYRWIQVTFPELVVLLERFVLVAAPISSLPSYLSTCIALSGSRLGAIPFAGGCIALQYLFAARRASSFLRKVEDDDMEHNAEDVPDEDLSLPALDRETAALLTTTLSLSPTIAYIALQSDPQMEPAMIFVTIIGLLGSNVIYLLWDPEVTLWFMRPTSTTMVGILRSDPLGLWPMMVKYRPFVLFFGYLAAMEAGVYRLLHSRFQYLFVGLPKPWNGILMIIIGLMITVIVVLIQRTLHATALQGQPVTKDKIAILLLSMVAAVGIAVVAGMPPFFHPLSALTASSFNAYLIDRRNGTNFFLFCITSALLLMWWMYRTFSFVIMDLRIMTDATVVPTPILTVSVLWCYLLGAISFGLSFGENKKPMAVALVLLAFKVGWVEHVLYSQRETGVYPGWLVFATSAAGVALALRLRKNEIMSVEAAAILMAVFISKLYTFLTEVTGAAYLEDNDIQGIRAVYVIVGFITALTASFLVSLMELRHREDTTNTSMNIDAIWAFAMMTFMALATAHGSILRAFVDALSNQFGAVSKELDSLLGAAIFLTAAISFPVIKRYAKRNAVQDCLVPMAVGVGLVVIHPFAFFTTELTDDGENFNTTPIGRLLLLASLLMLAAARFIPFRALPSAIRMTFWILTAGFASAALHLILYPASSLGFSASMFVFIGLTAIVVDICHNHNAGPESWIVYAVSVVAMIAAFIALASHLGSGAQTIEEWEMHDTARVILIGLGACVNMLLSIFVKFRLLGMPLLPTKVKLTESAVQHIGVIGNYATLLATCMLLLLNVWANESDIVMNVLAPSFLLMLVDDGVLFFELSRGSFRYFPVLITVLGALWAQLVTNSYATFLKQGTSAAVWDVLFAIPTLPSHLSLLFLLWHGGSKKGGGRLWSLVLFVMVDFCCIFAATRPVVQWMAIVGLTGQMIRLYVGQFWTHAADTIL